MSNIYPKSPPLWPRARTTVVMPPSRSALFASFYSRLSLVEPLQHLPCALPSHHSIPAALSLIVGASHLDEPLQDLEVTTLGCSPGRSSIPRTALAPRPAQDLQVTFTSSIITNIRVPRAGRILSPHPLQHHKVTALSCPATRPCPPRTPLRPQPLHHLKATALSCPTTR